jgi:hypothetical protein
MPTRRIAILIILMACVAVQGTFAQSATIETTPPRTAPAGSTVTIQWSAPNGPGDYITIVRKGAGPSEYLDYKRVSDGRTLVNPVSIVLPAEPGAYEIRYVRGNPRAVLTALPYEVTAVTATIEGPATVASGARFEIAWSGPNNGGDWVTIVPAGAAPRAYASYVDARSGRAGGRPGPSAATLLAPTQAGRYELRYVQQGSRVIGTRSIDVTAGTAPQMTASPLNTPALGIFTQPVSNANTTNITATIGPHTIALVGFTAAGTSISPPPRTIPLAGFTATGTAIVVPPRTFALPGWTATGTSTGAQGVIAP